MITTRHIYLLLALVTTISCENNSELEQNLNCREDNSSLICNGRGVCLDSVCECNLRPHSDEVISGQYCECDNFSCNRHNQLLCSGPDHGTCSCGVCQCNPGWIGDACDCRATHETCMRPDGQICSGHGTCECGTCRCAVTPDGRHSGRFCERCPTCAGLCHELKNCVQCQMYGTGPLTESEGMCAKNCAKIITTGVDTVEIDETKEEHLCTFYDDFDCRFQFMYRETVVLLVRAQRERECPTKSSHLLFLVLSLIILVVIIALVVLLYRKYKLAN